MGDGHTAGAKDEARSRPHPTSVSSEPIWIGDSAGLAAMTADLAGQTRLAVDTESNSLHAYREQVCLIQFSTAQTDYLVDPLAIADLAILAPLLASPEIEKIFHAAEYDLICLQRDFGFGFASLFDTMHASRILGYPSVGLDSLIGDKFGIKMEKHHQKADWAARPLSPSQVRYASLDTHFLLALRDLLEQELRVRGLWSLAQEDFRRFCRLEAPGERSSPNVVRKSFNRKDITARGLTILNELAQWREAAAEQLNRPPYKVVTDDLLMEIATSAPEHKTDLAALGLSERQIGRWGEAVLAAVSRGAKRPLIERTPTRKKDEAMLARLQKLKNWRKKAASELRVESDIVLPRPYLLAIAASPPRSRAELAATLQDSPTRFEHYGDQILSILGVVA